MKLDPPVDAVPSLVQLCVQKLAQSLIKYGPKKVRLGRLSGLPWYALEALLQILVAKNALNDNVLPHALTRQTQTLYLEGSSQLRRCLLNTIGRSCPQLRVLDVRACQQVDNRIVRDVLQHCEHLISLRLDGCARISDSAFAPALWKPPLAGLLGLRELSVARCAQVTAEGLMGYVMKGAPFLKTLALSYCRLTVSDEVAAELLFTLGLESLDISFCTQLTDAPFQARPSSMLRELRVASTNLTDVAIESIARRAPRLELLDAGWVARLTDKGVCAVLDACTSLRTLCVCNTQITDTAFEAIARCRHLERLDASWCLRATPRAVEILADAAVCADGTPCGTAPPLRDLKLDHIGALTLDLGLDTLAPLLPPASPDLWKPPAKSSMSTSSSPKVLSWLPVRLPAEPPSFTLPPSAQASSPLIRYSTWPGDAVDLTGGGATEPLSPGNGPQPDGVHPPWVPSPAPRPSLRLLVTAYAGSLRQLLIDGVRDVADASALEAVAECCPLLEQLALTAPPLGRDGAARDSDAALSAGLQAVGTSCRRLSLLRLDASLRPHRALIAPLAPPSFARLRSLTLWCQGRGGGGGLRDEELETILSDRTGLEALDLRNCEGLSDGLFPKWCNRERRDEAQVIEELDQALLSAFTLGFAGFGGPSPAAPAAPAAAPRAARRRHHPRCPPAAALRSVTSFSLGGAPALSDRSVESLAELLHDAQTVALRGCPQLTEESLRAFRKGCRFLRSVTIVTRERTLSWTAATSSVKRHHNRKSSIHTSGSSGTESN